MSAGAARRMILSVSSCIDKRTKKGCDRGSEIGTVHSEPDGRRSSEEAEKIWQKRELSERFRLQYSECTLSLP